MGLFRVQDDNEKYSLDRWIEVEGKSEKQTSIYSMQPKLLPQQLARDFLTVYFRTPEQLADYIINNFPRYPRVLSMLRGGTSESQVLEIWRDLVVGQRVGWGFTEEEASVVNKRLGIW